MTLRVIIVICVLAIFGFVALANAAANEARSQLCHLTCTP